MSDILATRNFRTNRTADYLLKTRDSLTGAANEKEVVADFKDRWPYVSTTQEDLAYIAASLFGYEKLFRDEDVPKVKGNDTLGIVLGDLSPFKGKGVGKLLEELASFNLKTSLKVNLYGLEKPKIWEPKISDKKFAAVSLFSGGTDSLVGISVTQRKLGPTHGVFVSQGDAIVNNVEKLSAELMKKEKLTIHSTRIQRGPELLQQFRGFAYLVFGCVMAKIHNTNALVISEVGPTMFLPEFTPLDEVTLTTHPTLMKLTKELFKRVEGSTYEFYTPFANLTKSEAIALCPNKALIPMTNSCHTTRWAANPFSHCGSCYGCIVRRISCLIANVPDARYQADALLKNVGDEIEGRGKRMVTNENLLENLMPILRFSRDILEDKLDDSTRLKIESFDKTKLYQRFALDVLSALYVLYEEGGQGNTKVKAFYEECKHDGVISPATAEDRISEVRENKYTPDFGIKV
jgi:hypothetical protein